MRRADALGTGKSQTDDYRLGLRTTTPRQKEKVVFAPHVPTQPRVPPAPVKKQMRPPLEARAPVSIFRRAPTRFSATGEQLKTWTPVGCFSTIKK